MGKKLEKLKRASGAVKKAARATGRAAKTAYAKRGEYAEKYQKTTQKIGKKWSQVQKKAQHLQETYPVFGGTEELFGFNQMQKPEQPDLLGNMGGVGVIDFGLSDYAAPRSVFGKVSKEAIDKELHEHPWMSRQEAARVVQDHKRRRR